MLAHLLYPVTYWKGTGKKRIGDKIMMDEADFFRVQLWIYALPSTEIPDSLKTGSGDNSSTDYTDFTDNAFGIRPGPVKVVYRPQRGQTSVSIRVICGQKLYHLTSGPIWIGPAS
ncbi:MAG: hypothetical protein IPL86_00500 [Flavobacteriales bacterium]|nr:hypothetical protein [Flavobacteriales bacterium]